jgi:CHAT domain-containing protein
LSGKLKIQTNYDFETDPDFKKVKALLEMYYGLKTKEIVNLLKIREVEASLVEIFSQKNPEWLIKLISLLGDSNEDLTIIVLKSGRLKAIEVSVIAEKVDYCLEAFAAFERKDERISSLK